MLRSQISEEQSTYAPPLHGLNLRESEHNLQPGEARLMTNCEYYGGVRIRRGTQRLTPGSLGTAGGIAGHKYYYGGSTPQKARLIAYLDRISRISDTGIETILTTGMPSGKDTYFTTWPITDCAYIVNTSATLKKYDGNTLTTITGTNIPSARAGVVPVLDRLLAITPDGIERTDPRVDNIWSKNSSWATFRPQRPGPFTALHPYTLRGLDTLYDGAIALQERAYYVITGTDYGTDVTSLVASVNEDSSIKLLDPTVGTGSPDSVCTVPGIGMFWFTSDLNVFWLPEGTLVGRYVGDKLQSTVATMGIESTNTAALRRVWMTYFDHILMLGIPVGSNTYSTIQFWMDMRHLREGQNVVWYGPMTGQSLGNVWVENQQGDNTLYGIEGNLTNGVFVYQLRVPARFTDAVGTADVPVSMVYQTMFKDFGIPSREKYIQAVHLDLNTFAGTSTLDLLDLDGVLASDIPIETISD